MPCQEMAMCLGHKHYQGGGEEGQMQQRETMLRHFFMFYEVEMVRPDKMAVKVSPVGSRVSQGKDKCRYGST